MNQQTLLQQLSTRTNLPKTQIARVLSALKDVVREELEEGKPASIPGLVHLDAYWRKPSVVRAPAGKKMLVDGRFVVRVRASSPLLRAVEGRSEQLAKNPEHQAAWRLAETLLGDLVLYFPDRAPRDLPAKISDEDLLAHARAAYGGSWERLVETYNARVPESVRESRNYLALVAQRLWGR